MNLGMANKLRPSFRWSQKMAGEMRAREISPRNENTSMVHSSETCAALKPVKRGGAGPLPDARHRRTRARFGLV